MYNIKVSNFSYIVSPQHIILQYYVSYANHNTVFN